MLRDRLTSMLRRDRAVVLGGLIFVVGLCWAYVLAGAGVDMDATGDMATGHMSMSMPMAAEPWTAGYFALIFVMWTVMMAAMMLPSAAPMLLLYATINGRRAQSAAARTGVFALGYISIWIVFSLVAATLQWRLEALSLLSPMMMTTNTLAAGLVLIAAGLYQWTPLKHACLRQCQSPLDFVLGHWREGTSGAFAMGLHHGLFCLGCCWMLMLLLFVGGVMNLLWISGIALFVLAEKVVPPGHAVSHLAGAALVLWGGMTLLSL